MPKTPEQVKKFIETLEDANFEVKSYSGRGMYGKSCVSVSQRDGEDTSAWEIARELFHADHDGEFDNVPEPRQDSLGLGIVLYWPSYEWPQEKAS